ncbi:MAG: hypothetical protein EU548_00550 [Promethearchaeota archaeon]|nr:MAG: hypothetical protein EU548_00550 [Candidatus Lokiarchaeota archaeon]
MLKHPELIKIVDSKDISEINETLDQLLYVPNELLKPRIIEELVKYYIGKFSEDDYKIKFFIAYDENKDPCGFISCEINPNYRSRNRRCATFGWLHTDNFDVCKGLITACENFVRKNNVRLIRGNVNFPKSIGGIGIQVMGFEEQMLYSVPFGEPFPKILGYLERLGYNKDAEYICMEVTKERWDQGKRVDKSIRLGYLTLKELHERKEELINVAKEAFYAVVPDACTGRVNEILEIYDQVPESHYKLKKEIDPLTYFGQPEYKEVWESYDLEKVVVWAPMAFDRKTGEIVGTILAVHDLYELWLGQPITRANVDTAMIKSEYKGRGIFSALNNLGQLCGNLIGVNYYEGTGIWLINQDAIDAVMPHCQTNRKFVVFQKRLKKSKA